MDKSCRALGAHVGLGLALSMLVVAGCATVRPDFERTFRGGRPSHDLWMRVLTSRYGCDTVAVVADTRRRDPRVGPSPATAPGRQPQVGVPSLSAAPERGMRVGMAACDVASQVAPEEVAAWVTPEGIREEWKFRVNWGPLTSVYLEGREPRALRVAPPVPQ